MASVPVSMDKLEQIVEIVARNLLEKWAVEDRFTEEEIAKFIDYATDDTAFIINEFMSLFNQTMMDQAAEKNIIN